MAKIIQGNLDATGSRFAIVASRFNSFVVERLLSAALDALERNGARPDDITVAVPVRSNPRWRRPWRFQSTMPSSAGAPCRGNAHFLHRSTVTRGLNANLSPASP
jgi:hypothetical protein